MKAENELGMIAAFYLSKYGKKGLRELGFPSYRQAFIEIGRCLGVNPNSVKNWRDEFDPYYDNERKGWYQRNIRPSRQKVMLAFDTMSEVALRAIIAKIITPNGRLEIEDTLRKTIEEIQEVDKQKDDIKKNVFIPRGVTGRMAEEFFMTRFSAGLTPFSGYLFDKRDEGVGFDFQIEHDQEHKFVEIKGLARNVGGVTFTDKEWRTANEKHESYFLGLVTDVFDLPGIQFIQNPAGTLNPRQYIYTSVSVSWSIGTDHLLRIAPT